MIPFRSICLLTCILIAGFAAHGAKSPSNEIYYRLSFPEPHTHYVEVEMHADRLAGKFIDVKMPVWAPGSYLVREFPRHVERFRATDVNQHQLKHVKISKDTWRIKLEGNRSIQIRYAVYANELSVRTSFIDEEHAYLNGTSVFLYINGEAQRPCKVSISPHSSWKRMSVALSPHSPSDPWTVHALNYDQLVDAPFEIGNHSVFQFNAAGVLHEVAMYGIESYDSLRLKKDMGRIVEACTNVFGIHPCKRYVFIVHHLVSGGGGLEHENSTTLQTSRSTYATENSYAGFMSLVAHEYFHLWNVKRLRPLALGPFDYSSENYTDLLWFSEGFTAYYDDLIAWRCGFYTDEEYFKALASGLSYCRNIKGGEVQTLSESSTEAWVKFYRPHENSSNTSVSYYTKGAAVAFLTDMRIRKLSSGTKSLDDVMKQLYQKHVIEKNRGIVRSDLEEACAVICGMNSHDFFGTLVDSVGFPDPTAALEVVGLSMKNLNDGSLAAWTGIATSTSGGKLTVSSIERGSPAWDAGINVNDELIAAGDLRIGDDFTKAIATYRVGDTLPISISRNGKIREFELLLRPNPNVKYLLSKNPAAVELTEADRSFQSWSGKKNY